MQMIFKKGTETNLSTVDRLRAALELTRFSATIETEYSNKPRICIKNIRLRKIKPYCGNHPSVCEFPDRKLKKAKFLEGLDWIAFNDFLNAFCDVLSLDVDIKSAVCRIRYGKERRVEYSEIYKNGRVPEWQMEGEHEETPFTLDKWIMSDYPSGTPGEYEVFSDRDCKDKWKRMITSWREQDEKDKSGAHAA